MWLVWQFWFIFSLFLVHCGLNRITLGAEKISKNTQRSTFCKRIDKSYDACAKYAQYLRRN